MTELRKKKYLIKDTSVNGIDDDLFNYADIASVLEQILMSNEPPYNIAIIGKWGLGKSSLINLVKNKLGNRDTFLFQEINAWKYEKESLRRVFLKHLWQGISGEKLKSFQEIQRNFSDLINNAIFLKTKEIKVKAKWKDKLRKFKIEAKNFLRKYILPVLGIIIFTIICFTIYKLIQAQTENTTIDFIFWEKTFLSYCKNIATTLLLPVLITLLTALHNEYKKKEPKKFEFSFPLETADDYELFLENSIADKLKDNPDLKIVTIIDDLDRLSLDKIVEALDSIKAFVNLPNCLFIVPFDDEIIKSALEKRRETQFGETCDVIESELILDKLFQFKIYLPPLLRYDIRQYTINLAKREIPDFIADYCPEETFNRLVNRIIIHSDVTTPRQVKKLVNAFVNNYLIAREREASGRVEKGLLTGNSGIEQIAKISVLQADFNSFYDLLFKDFSYITRFVEIAQSQCTKSDVPEDLQEYFTYKDDDDNDNKVVDCVRPIYEPLLNFLISRAKYSVDNIATFLYLAQDAISIKTGDEQQHRAIAALESGNDSTLKAMLENKPEIAEAVVSYMLDCVDVELPLQAAYSILPLVGDKYVTSLANILVERSIEPGNNFAEISQLLSPDNVLYAVKNAERKEHSMILVESYLSVIVDKNNSKKELITNALETFIPEYKSLSPNAQESIRSATNICCHNDDATVKSILPLLDYSDSSMFAMLWGVDWFSKLCTHITSENDYKSDVIDSLEKSFDILMNNVDFSEIIQYVIPLFKLPPLLGELDDMFSEIICSKLDDSTSTEIANELIVHEYDENSKNIHKLLSKLKYVVNDDNAEAMATFTANYATSALMDDVLVYLGANDYFSYIEPTLSMLVKDIFEDDNNDELLNKICSYLPEDIRKELFDLLSQKTIYIANKDYTRELVIISILAADSSYESGLEDYAKNTLFSQANANQNYYPQCNYFDFIADAASIIKSLLQQTTIDGYVDKLISIFPSQSAKCLYVFERLSGRFSKEIFAKVFSCIITNIMDSEFDQALTILIDNDKVRPKESDEIAAYRKFLTSHLEKSSKPNRVLQTLKNSFSYFSEMQELTTFALGNSATDRNLLIDVIVQCLNNYKDINRVANEVLPMFEGKQKFAVLQVVFAKLTNYSVDDVIVALSEKLEESTSMNILSNIAEYAVKYDSFNSATLYAKALNLILNHDNVPDQVVKTISMLSELKQSSLEPIKDPIITSLYSCFTCTTSESIQLSIVNVIRQQRWTRQFKRMLKDNEDKLNLFDKLAK